MQRSLTSIFSLLLIAALAPMLYAQAGEAEVDDSTPQETPTEAPQPAPAEPKTKDRFPSSTGYQWGLAFYPDVEAAIDPEKPETFRLRMIDEVGRYGDDGMTSRLQEALGDESPAIRIATMRALMRLGIDDARPQLYDMLKNTDSDANERAWAARALSRSKAPKETVPQLIAALGGKDGKAPADGEQAALIDSLRRLTGMSLGARPKTLFTAFLGDEAGKSQEAYREDWSQWWDKNKDGDPETWRFNALASQIPKDRASAARLLAKGDNLEALPKLLDAFRREAEEGGTSAVREAIAEALEELTGIKTNYSPFKTDEQTKEEWDESHHAAHKAWSDFQSAVKVDGKNPFLLRLEAKDPKTRAAVLRELNYEKRADIGIRDLVKMLSDESGQVAQEAWKSLVRTTGIAFPFDPSAEPELKAIQIARWDDWAREFETSDDSVRLLSIFAPLEEFHWGSHALSVYPAVAEEAKKELESSLVSLRSRALSHIAIKRVRVAASELIRNFEEEIRLCEAALQRGSPRDFPIYSLLQKNYIHALSTTGDHRVPPLILRRLRIAQDARRELASPGALDDPDVVRTCVYCLGEIGEYISAAPVLRDLTLGVNETRYRVRGQAARALGRCGDSYTRSHLVSILENAGEHIYVRLGAIDGLSALARRFSSEHAGITAILRRLWQDMADRESEFPIELRRAGKRAYDALLVAPSD